MKTFALRVKFATRTLERSFPLKLCIYLVLVATSSHKNFDSTSGFTHLYLHLPLSPRPVISSPFPLILACVLHLATCSTICVSVSTVSNQ